MKLKDPNIERLVKTKTPIHIKDEEFYIEKSVIGSCDGCYFIDKICPAKAVTICCSNGGNILKKVDNGR